MDPVDGVSAPEAQNAIGGAGLWRIEEPDEIVSYRTFDPALVADKLPAEVEFVLIGDVADQGLSWAKRHLERHPDHRDWGISFLEIIRADTFSIGSEEPDWPEGGAAAVWFARLRAKDTTAEYYGQTLYLALGFWLPDHEFVQHMNDNSYFAAYADITLRRQGDQDWKGSIHTHDLDVRASCEPIGDIHEYSSGGRQYIIPPADSEIDDVIRVDFIGHKIQECETLTDWEISGEHPLASSVSLNDMSYQFGYSLTGATQ